jgi:hypothetical protein
VAGWLFAELALVLMVIAVGSETTAPSATPTVTVTTSAPSPSVTTTTGVPGTNELGLRLDTVIFMVSLSGDGSGAVEEFRNLLTERVGPNHTVGLALLFGVADGGSSGTQVSGRLRDLIVAARIPQMPSAEFIRPYLGDEGGAGAVKVELFLLTS